MADSDKPTPKKVIEKEVNQVPLAKVQLKPAPTMLWKAFPFQTKPLACACEEIKSIPLSVGYCFVCNKHPNFPYFQTKLEDKIPATQVDDIEDDEVLDSNEESALPVAKRVKKEKKDDDKPHILYPRQHVCIYKWGQIEVGQKYMAMSVGQESRSRTGIVLVPI